MIAQREQTALLGALAIDADARDGLDEPLAVRAWPLPGDRPRPPVVREPGAPEWWDGPGEASGSFARALGLRL